MTVYVDVLLALNLYVNYLLLLSTRKILKLEHKTFRMLSSSAIGALYSLIIFVPELSGAVRLPINLAVASLMVYVCFNPANLKKFIKQLLTFTAVNFMFAGIMFGIWLFAAPEAMFYNNRIVYFDIDIKLLIILSVICYAVIRTVMFFIGKSVISNHTVSVSIFYNGKSVTANALVDTGHSLVDSVTGEAVVIADSTVVKALLGNILSCDSPDCQQALFQSGVRIRLIPINTVSSSGLLPAFKSDGITVNKKREFKNVLIAQSKTEIKGDYSVILNSDFIN